LAHVWLLDLLLELGDIDAVGRELEALQRLLQTRRERHLKWLVAAVDAGYAFLGGRLEDCEMLAHDAFAHRYEGNDELTARVFGVHMLHVRSMQGRLDEFLQPVQSFVAQFPQIAAWRCVLAYIYTQLDRTAHARRLLAALAQEDFQDLARDANRLPSLVTLSQVVAILNDAPRAQQLYKLLSPYADHNVVTGLLVCAGSASRPLGLLATTLSRYEDAQHHFEHALKMNTKIRSPLWIAYTQHDYARMLLLRKGPGDRDTALELLDQALATADQLGLKALADKAALLKLAAKAPTPAPALPGSRSP
jgi:tetratricopeptide (TPR) repeat protein